MSNKEVLISGGGIADSTLACWLAHRGFRPTVVERAGELARAATRSTSPARRWTSPSAWG